MDHNTLVAVLSVAFLALSLGIHEAAHAFVAWRCGDSTAKDMGRMTLNPIAHIDLMMTIVVPLIMYLFAGFLFGGAKPVPVNPHRLRNPLRDMMLVALAGPLANVILALIFMLAYKSSVFLAGYPPNALLPEVMFQAVRFNVLLAVFNLVPIPPLDGSRVMAYLLPAPMRETYVSLERFGLLIVIAVVFYVPGFQEFLFRQMRTLEVFLAHLTGGAW